MRSKNANVSLCKEDDWHVVLVMQRFLRKLNFGDQFCRRKGKAGNLRETIFKPLGECSGDRQCTYGTLLKGKGNYRPPRSLPVRDAKYHSHKTSCSTVQQCQILVPRKITGSNITADKAFVNRPLPGLAKLTKLSKIKMEKRSRYPSHKLSSDPTCNHTPVQRSTDLLPWI
jgi:hypothetical protein